MTQEEKKEYGRKYREAHKEKMKEYQKKYREQNRETLLSYQKEYRDTHKEQQKTAWHDWYERNKEKHKEHNKQYAVENKEKVEAYGKQYRLTKYGRAAKLLSGYKSSDKKQGREKSFNLTHQWIIDHIFNSSCIYCGETDWTKLGCDRIDNTKAHTTDNCVCACSSCNTLRQKKDFKEFLLSQNPSVASEILSSLGL